VAIETYGEAKQAWLEVLDFNGIPAHDTFARVLGAAAASIAGKFSLWVSSISQKLVLDVIHIDGKTAKGSYDREENSKACIASVPGAVSMG